MKKNKQLSAQIKQYEPDILCISELNTAWHLLPMSLRLGDRVKGWFKQSTYTECAWYKSYPKIRSPRQPGGCAIIVLNNTVGRVVT
jgi:hypothetical protein